MYDVVIIGAGPAGIAAAIYAVRKTLKTLVLAKILGGQAAISGDIQNYLGYSLIQGPELAKKFREHLAEFKLGCTLIEGVEVTNLRKINNSSGGPHFFEVATIDGKKFQGKSVIIASGREPRLLGVPGEKEFLGKGVSTCATCDAPLFQDKTVAVVGGGNSAMEAIFSLLKIAKKIYIINFNPELRGDEVLKQQILSSPNVEHIPNVITHKILGDGKVTGIESVDTKTAETKRFDVDGVFVEIGYSAQGSTTFDKLTQKDDFGRIKVNSDLETGIGGLFAAGDVNNLWGEQIVIAAGEGAKAALKAGEYLAKLPKTNDHYE